MNLTKLSVFLNGKLENQIHLLVNCQGAWNTIALKWIELPKGLEFYCPNNFLIFCHTCTVIVWVHFNKLIYLLYDAIFPNRGWRDSATRQERKKRRTQNVAVEHRVGSLPPPHRTVGSLPGQRLLRHAPEKGVGILIPPTRGREGNKSGTHWKN